MEPIEVLVWLGILGGIVAGWFIRGAWEKFKVDWEAEKDKKQHQEREWQDFEQWKRDQV